jgi:hypothetical protein
MKSVSSLLVAVLGVLGFVGCGGSSLRVDSPDGGRASDDGPSLGGSVEAGTTMSHLDAPATGPCGGSGEACCAVGPACEAKGCCVAGACLAAPCEVCGTPGQACCSGVLCAPGAICAEKMCRSCGGAGEACCPVGACTAGGCCFGGNCVASGQSCGGSGACSAGRCAACGGKEQPCCGTGASARCQEPGSACQGALCRPCGGPGQACCPGDGVTPRCAAGARCGADGTCQTCGGPGQPCCPGNTCGGGGCCFAARCQAPAEACRFEGRSYGSCQAGKCGCGGAEEPCCPIAEGGSDADACIDPKLGCNALPGPATCGPCGHLGGICCAGKRCTDPGTACLPQSPEGFLCRKCGGNGEPCCLNYMGAPLCEGALRCTAGQDGSSRCTP